MIPFTFFLERLDSLLETGRTTLAGREIYVENCISRAAEASHLFERECYKRLGSVSPKNHCIFYTHLLNYLISQDSLESFQYLDTRSKEILKRSLDSAVEYLPSRYLEISNLSKLLS